MQFNLGVCPEELKQQDPNAEIFWFRLLKKVGVVISRGEHIETRCAWIVRNLGLPSLLQRLKPGMTEQERARVWWREAAACSEGESVPDLTAENLCVLNPWIVSASHKFPRPAKSLDDCARLDVVPRRGRPAKTREEKLARKAARERCYRGAKRGALIENAPYAA
jgi:hypothetical protein